MLSISKPEFAIALYELGFATETEVDNPTGVQNIMQLVCVC